MTTRVDRCFVFLTALSLLGLSIFGLVLSDFSPDARGGFFFLILISVGLISIATAFEAHSRLQKSSAHAATSAGILVTRSKLCLALLGLALLLFAIACAVILSYCDWKDAHQGLLLAPAATIGIVLFGYSAIRLMRQCLRRNISLVILPEGIDDHATERGLISWSEIVGAREERGLHLKLLLINMETPTSFWIRLWRRLSGSESKITINLFGASADAATLLPLVRSNIQKKTLAGVCS